MSDHDGEPLPRSWLPDPAGPAEDDASPAWERRVRRIMSEAAPRLDELRADAGPSPAPDPADPGVRRGPRTSGGSRGWVGELGRLWRPAAGLAAAAAAALALLPAGDAGEPPGSWALAVAAADGEPAALWRAAGQAAHPVLAAVALEAGDAGTDDGPDTDGGRP